MHNFSTLQSSPLFVVFLWSCDKVYHKQEVRFLLYLLGQAVTLHYNPYLFIKIDNELLYMIMTDS